MTVEPEVIFLLVVFNDRAISPGHVHELMALFFLMFILPAYCAYGMCSICCIYIHCWSNVTATHHHLETVNNHAIYISSLTMVSATVSRH